MNRNSTLDALVYAVALVAIVTGIALAQAVGIGSVTAPYMPGREVPWTSSSETIFTATGTSQNIAALSGRTMVILTNLSSTQTAYVSFDATTASAAPGACWPLFVRSTLAVRIPDTKTICAAASTANKISVRQYKP